MAEANRKMREIGGYIELEHHDGSLFHEKALRLNCGRNALAYLCRARNIQKVWIPHFLCDCVDQLLDKIGVEWACYRIGRDWLPDPSLIVEKGDWFYVVNYYGQVSNASIHALKQQYPRLIVDNCHDYFRAPVAGVDTLYTCRKFFGVPDGAFLYTDAPAVDGLERDVSYDRMRYLLGRMERPASEFYAEYVKSNADFAKEPVKRMSRLTENLLRSIDYARVQRIRSANWHRLSERLGKLNELLLTETVGPFAYPLLVSHGRLLRKKLIEQKIYVPTLWPAVLERCGEVTWEHRLASDLLPLPVDQRYGIDDMNFICDAVLSGLL